MGENVDLFYLLANHVSCVAIIRGQFLCYRFVVAFNICGLFVLHRTALNVKVTVCKQRSMTWCDFKVKRQSITKRVSDIVMKLRSCLLYKNIPGNGNNNKGHRKKYKKKGGARKQYLSVIF